MKGTAATMETETKTLTLRERAVEAFHQAALEKVEQQRIAAINQATSEARHLKAALERIGIEAEPENGTITVEGLTFRINYDYYGGRELQMAVPNACWECGKLVWEYIPGLESVGKVIAESNENPTECSDCRDKHSVTPPTSQLTPEQRLGQAIADYISHITQGEY